VAARVNPLADIPVLTPILRKVSGESFLVALVMSSPLGGVLSRVSLPPTTHRLACLLGVASYPVAAVLASAFRIFVWHGIHLAATRRRSKRKKRGLAAAPLLRGDDSNVCPSGYEPDELPLLHPANQFYLYRGPKKYANQRAIREGLSFSVRASASLACPSRCTAMIDSFGAMYP
jgi:hypothetical protein